MFQNTVDLTSSHGRFENPWIWGFGHRRRILSPTRPTHKPELQTCNNINKIIIIEAEFQTTKTKLATKKRKKSFKSSKPNLTKTKLASASPPHQNTKLVDRQTCRILASINPTTTQHLYTNLQPNQKREERTNEGARGRRGEILAREREKRKRN